MKKRILLLQTGGTISMTTKQDGSTWLDAEMAAHLVEKELPELSGLASIDNKMLFNEDSSNLTSQHWSIITNAIEQYYHDYDGFVILHGTDTMAYTASALSFSIQNLTKPIILTGSQVPLQRIRSDARRNVVNAVEVATMDLPEIAICFGDRVFRGNRSTKLSIGDFDAFGSPNLLPLADIGIHIEMRNELIRTPNVNEPTSFHPTFDEHIYVVKVFPGLKPELLYPLLDLPIKALIFEGFGSGNLPTVGDHSLIPLIRKMVDKEVLVTMVSQAPFDSVDLQKYESGRLLMQAGALSGHDMTIEAASTKLMFILSQNLMYEERILMFNKNIAGEVTL